ncbi:lantibiotic dehydratase [Kitasatospora griseola]|uniref:lantibiotic dehydratase n=1 Tax=Kitasatospora griseola TaxID=2064 RepID=UPI00381B31F9
MYRIAGPALVRAASLPATSTPKWWPGLAGDRPGSAETWRRWLAHVAVPDVREVLESTGTEGRNLVRRVSAAAGGEEMSTAALRRIAESVMVHLLMRTRPTPNGLLAGVTVAPFDAHAVAPRWGAGRVVARPDGRWLADVLSRVEALVGDELSVVANPLHVRRGDRVVLADRTRRAEASVTATGPVLAVLKAAAGTAYTLAELTGHLAREFEWLDLARARELVAELLHAGLLISVLRPPMTATNPLRHVLTAAARVGADRAPDAEPAFAELRYIAQELDTHNGLDDPMLRRVVRRRLAAREPGQDAAGLLLSLDLRLDAGPLVLPAGVEDLITDAAQALVRLSPDPGGDPVWADYRRRFLDAYGPGAVVPLLELVSPDTGLGYPAGYRGSILPDVPAPPFGDRDARLLALAQEASARGLTQIRLDGPLIGSLMPVPPVDAVPPHMELTVRLVATGPARSGPQQYGVVVEAQPRPCGTTVGRFLHLLNPTERAQMQAALRGAPAAWAGSRAVQVSAPPLHPRNENAARVPALLRVLAVGEYPQQDVEAVDLAGIGVCADEERLWLVSLDDGRPVEARVLTPVGLRSTTRSMVRFLAEIGTAFHPWPTAFHWGSAASTLPALPRVVLGQAVLSPARWNLRAAELPGRNAQWEEWRAAARAWLSGHRVPPRVYLAHHGRKLPLNLDVPDHLLLLRNHFTRDERAILVEAPVPADNEWCGGRTVEITVQLHAAAPPQPARRPARAASSRDWQLPGASPVLAARLHGNPHRATEVLDRVAELTRRWVIPPEWWFIRDTGPEPHLHLVLSLPDESAWPLAAERVGEWARELRADGLLTHTAFPTYRPPNRFGRGTVLRAAQHVLAADSRAALAQLAYQRTTGINPAAITAVSLLRLATALLGPAAGHAWLLNHLPTRPVPVTDAARRDAVELAHRHGLLDATGEGHALDLAWKNRADALAHYRTALRHADAPDPETVLATLLDDHHARTGGELADGRISRWLARLCIESPGTAATDGASRTLPE